MTPHQSELLCNHKERKDGVSQSLTMIGRSALWVARQHGHSISTMLCFHAVWAGGAGESDVDTIRATLNSEVSLSRRASRGARTMPSRPIARPFEMALWPTPTSATNAFASGNATERGTPTARSLKYNEIIGGERGIRSSSINGINNLLNSREILSPLIPRCPRIWQ